MTKREVQDEEDTWLSRRSAIATSVFMAAMFALMAVQVLVFLTSWFAAGVAVLMLGNAYLFASLARTKLAGLSKDDAHVMVARAGQVLAMSYVVSGLLLCMSTLVGGGWAGVILGLLFLNVGIGIKFQRQFARLWSAPNRWFP